MDTMTVNKIIGALLLALLLAKGSEILGEIPFRAGAPETPAYAVALPEAEQVEAEAEAEPEGPTLPVLLAQASADAGERAFRKCAACHSIEEGGANRVGPNLYDTVGAQVARVESFNYSEALASYEGRWTHERLDAWLEAPDEMIPGNRMAFAGISDAEERADLIVYLRANTAAPPPLPGSAQAQQANAAENGDAVAASAEEASTPADTGASESAAAAETSAADETAETSAADETAETSAADETAETSPDSEMAAASGNGETAGATSAGEAASASSQSSPLASALASASVARGEKLFNRCSMCHTMAKGGGPRVGPNLYGMVGEDIASAESYAYSDALSSLEGSWTYERLDRWLENPMQMVQGTKMAFPGLPELQDRADIIVYLRSYDDSPPPLPDGAGGG